MLPAHQKDDALLAEIHAADAGRDAFHLWWLGQSGFLLKWRGQFLLFDPYLSDSLTEKYAATDKPHVRITERAIAPEALDASPLVTSSHNHTDHLDAATLQPLARANGGLKLALPAANVDFARERLGADSGIDLVGLEEGRSSTFGEFELHAVAAAHNAVERDGSGRPRFIGIVAKFGSWSVYHSGDTLWHRDLLPSLLPHSVDLALVPINGNRPERRVAGNLNGTEAAALAKGIGARLAVPHHFDMFEFNTEPPDEFTAACGRLGLPCRVLRNGEGLCSVDIPPRP